MNFNIGSCLVKISRIAQDVTRDWLVFFFLFIQCSFHIGIKELVGFVLARSLNKKEFKQNCLHNISRQ